MLVESGWYGIGEAEFGFLVLWWGVGVVVWEVEVLYCLGWCWSGCSFGWLADVWVSASCVEPVDEGCCGVHVACCGSCGGC